MNSFAPVFLISLSDFFALLRIVLDVEVQQNFIFEKKVSLCPVFVVRRY